jgi:hypothetical protein
MTRKILKAIGWGVGGLAGLCVILYLLAVAINWRDREPSPSAVRFASLHRDLPVLADEDNAFVYLMGFGVSPGESPSEMGLKRVTWMQESRGGAALDVAKDPLGERPDYRSERDPAIREYLETCGPRPRNSDCATAFDTADRGFDQWMTSENWLLERYKALIAHAGWREPVPFDVAAPLPSYGLVADGQKLLLLHAKVLARKGDHAGVRQLLGGDLRFWRTVFESSDTLISKMIATGALSRHFELGNLVFRDLQPDSVTRAVPVEWQTAISDSERSMLRCLIGEWMFMSGVLRNVAGEVATANEGSVAATALALLTEPLYQPQDTINRYAEYFARMVEILSVPFDRYEVAVDQTAELATQTFPPRSAYNVIGQVLLGLGMPSYESYARRVGDVEGVRRAALAAVTLRASDVKAHEVAAALSAAPLRNPYNEQPFAWDEKDSAIIFRGLEADERGEHRIHYY